MDIHESDFGWYCLKIIVVEYEDSLRQHDQSLASNDPTIDGLCLGVKRYLNI